MAALTSSSLRLASGAASTSGVRTRRPTPAALLPARRVPVIARATEAAETTPAPPATPATPALPPANTTPSDPPLTTWQYGKMKTPGLEWWYIAAIFVPVAALIALPLAMNAGAPPPTFAPAPNVASF